MKKIFTILCVTLFILNASAQSEGEMKFGIFTGANYAMPFGDDMEDFKDDLEDNMDDLEDMGYDAEGGVYGRLGFHVGFGMDYFIKDNLAITSSLSYSQKGAKINQEVEGEQTQQVMIYDYAGGPWDYYSVTLDNYSKSKANVQLDYLDLPIGIKFQTDDGLTVFGGILFSFLVNETVKFETEEEYQYIEYSYEYDQFGSSYQVGYTVLKDSDSDSDSDDYDDTIDDDDPNSTLTGFQVGVGYTVGNFNIAFKLNRNSNFGDIDGYGDDNHNVTLQLSTGVTF